jgi:hypothetical protein
MRQKPQEFLVDELQYIEEREFSALIMAIHKLNQTCLPIILIGAGLPQILALAGSSKSYAERLFRYPNIGNYLVDVPKIGWHMFNDRPARAHSDSGYLPALAHFVARLQEVGGAIDEFGKLAQRWNNRLVLEGFPLSELYLDRRIAIALVVDVGPGADPGFPRFADYGPIGQLDADQHVNRPRGASRRVIFLILADRDNEITGLDDCGDEHSMLIHSIKAVKAPEPTVTASLVRFYDVSNYQREIGCDSLYKSVLFGIYKGLPRILQREVSKGRVIYAPSGNYGAGDKIKGCAEIVDGIANDGGDVFGESRRSLYQDCVAFASEILVLVGGDGINVRLDQIKEPRFKLLDVFVGPFDL